MRQDGEHKPRLRLGRLSLPGLKAGASRRRDPGEPFLVYEMSAFALVFAGMGVVITAVLAIESSDTADTVEDLIEQEEGEL